MLTAYDYPMARCAEAAGVDAVLVGDSLGMVVLGHDSTLPVTVDDIVRHSSAVSRACERALVVADMPFMSYQADLAEGMRNAGRLIVEGGAQAVKVEGASRPVLALVRQLVDSGVPVMGHLGLTPQSVNVLGGYRTQAKGVAEAAKLLADAVELTRAGVFAIVLELIGAELAERVSALVGVPTIGIGAGAGCDGQVQVAHDVLGFGEFVPRHARRYADISDDIARAFSHWVDDVREGAFPAEENFTHVEAEVVTAAEILFARQDEEPSA